MPQTGKSRSASRKPRAHRAKSGLLSITVDPHTARIVRVESVDARGARHRLSPSERATLLQRTGDGEDGGIDALVERAFEAGIACVLDDEPAASSADESAEDAALRHKLLAPLLARSGVRRLLKRPEVDRALLTTLIDHAAR